MRFDSLTSFDIFFIILSSFFPLQLLPIILKPKQSLFFSFENLKNLCNELYTTNLLL